MERPRKRILYHWLNEFMSFHYPVGQERVEYGVDVWCAYNQSTAERFFLQGPYDIIATHIGDPPGGVAFAQEARKRYKSALIIGLHGAAPERYKHWVEQALGDNNPFDDFLLREPNERGMSKTIGRLIEFLAQIEVKQIAAGAKC